MCEENGIPRSVREEASNIEGGYEEMPGRGQQEGN